MCRFESSNVHLRMKTTFDFGGNKRGRESFFDRIASHSVEDSPCHAARVSLLETSPIIGFGVRPEY